MRCLPPVAVATLLSLFALSAPGADTKAPDAKSLDVKKITEVGGKSLDQWVEETQPRKNPDPYVRETALRAIAQFGPDGRKALPALVARLADTDASVCANAIAAIRGVGVDPKDSASIQSVVAGLTKTLQSGTSVARVQSALVLAEFGPEAKSAIPVLIRDTIKSPISWEMRRTGVFALGRLGFDPKGPDSTVVKALTGVAKDDACAQVRLQAIMSL